MKTTTIHNNFGHNSLIINRRIFNSVKITTNHNNFSCNELVFSKIYFF